MRQTPISEIKLEKLLTENWTEWEDTKAKEGYSRNQLLIDLTLIPGGIKTAIINTYNETKVAPRSKLLTYFVEYKLKNLMDVIEEF